MRSESISLEQSGRLEVELDSRISERDFITDQIWEAERRARRDVPMRNIRTTEQNLAVVWFTFSTFGGDLLLTRHTGDLYFKLRFTKASFSILFFYNVLWVNGMGINKHVCLAPVLSIQYVTWLTYRQANQTVLNPDLYFCVNWTRDNAVASMTLFCFYSFASRSFMHRKGRSPM